MTDSLLGVRYVLDTQQPAGASQALFSINLPAPYGTAYAYQNTYALPVGYGVEADADNIEWTDDPFGCKALRAARRRTSTPPPT